MLGDEKETEKERERRVRKGEGKRRIEGQSVQKEGGTERKIEKKVKG